MTKDDPASLVGKTFDCDFGAFVPRLTVLSTTELRVQATIGDAAIDEVVASELAGLRPDLFVVSWREQNGNFVVQVQDHEKMRVHNYARLADGQHLSLQGAIQPVIPPVEIRP